MLARIRKLHTRYFYHNFLSRIWRFGFETVFLDPMVKNQYGFWARSPVLFIDQFKAFGCVAKVYSNLSFSKKLDKNI